MIDCEDLTTSRHHGRASASTYGSDMANCHRITTAWFVSSLTILISCDEVGNYKTRWGVVTRWPLVVMLGSEVDIEAGPWCLELVKPSQLFITCSFNGYWRPLRRYMVTNFDLYSCILHTSVMCQPREWEALHFGECVICWVEGSPAVTHWFERFLF